MRAVLLVAVREIRQVLGTRGFWVMLLIVPLALAASTFASSKLAPSPMARPINAALHHCRHPSGS